MPYSPIAWRFTGGVPLGSDCYGSAMLLVLRLAVYSVEEGDYRDSKRMSNINIIVREATRQDTDDIVRFQQGMALETEGKVLDEVILKNGITAIFDSSEKGFYLVAEVDDHLVGSLLITYEWSDWRNATFLVDTERIC